MLRSAMIFCLLAACGRQPSPPAPGSGASGTVPAADRPAGAAGSGAGSGSGNEECDVAECGPPMRLPTRQCPDGSMAGPTDRCLRHADGRCGWEVRQCP